MSMLCNQINVPFAALVSANAKLVDDDDAQAQAFHTTIAKLVREDKNTPKLFNKYGGELIKFQKRIKDKDESLIDGDEMALFRHMNLAENWPRFRPKHRKIFWKHMSDVMKFVGMVGASSAGGNRAGIEDTAMTVVERMAAKGVLSAGQDVDPWEVADDALEQLTDGDMFERVSSMFSVDDVGSAASAMEALGMDPASLLPAAELEELHTLRAEQAAGTVPTPGISGAEGAAGSAKVPTNEESDERMAQLSKTIKAASRGGGGGGGKKKKKRRDDDCCSDSDCEGCSSSSSDSESDSSSDDEDYNSKQKQKQKQKQKKKNKKGGPAGPERLFDTMFKSLAKKQGIGGDDMSAADQGRLKTMMGQMSSKIFSNNDALQNAMGMHGGGGDDAKKKKVAKEPPQNGADDATTLNEKEEGAQNENEVAEVAEAVQEEGAAAVKEDAAAAAVDEFD